MTRGLARQRRHFAFGSPFARAPMVVSISLALAACVPEPTCAGVGACDGIQGPYRRQCIDFCAALWDFTDTASPDQTCLLDPCDADAYEDSDVRACPAGSHCVPDVGRNVCERRLTVLDPCDPADDQCGDGLACVAPLPPAAPDVCDRVSSVLDPPPDGPICWFAASEGQPCDSNMADIEFGLARGCAPCVEGTWCVERGLFDPDHRSSTEHICVRSCTSAGSNPIGDPGMCACDADVQCLPAIDDVLGPGPEGPGTGDKLGPWFCTPCLPNGASGCEGADAPFCCDSFASCEEVDVQASAPIKMCCRAEGVDCDADAALPQCCPGTFCNGVSCEECVVGPVASTNDTCCPGTRLVSTGGSSGSSYCAPCADERYALDLYDGEETVAWCSDYTFAVASVDGKFDAAFIPSPDVSYPRHFEGAIGGDLQRSGGQTSFASYALAPQHHTFLFDASLSSGVGLGDRYIELPRDDDAFATMTSVLLPDAVWRSFRMYDPGECSEFISFGTLSIALSVALNHALGDPDVLEYLPGLRANGGLSLSPILAGDEGGAFGVLNPRDQVQLEARYHASSLGGCSEPDIVFSATLGVGTEIGWDTGPTTAATDLLVRGAPMDAAPQSVCTVGTDTVTCVIPRETSPGVYTTDTRELRLEEDLYWWAPPDLTMDEVDQLEILFAAAHCDAARDEYSCTGIPHLIEDIECCPTDPDCPVDTCPGSDEGVTGEFVHCAPYRAPGTSGPGDPGDAGSCASPTSERYRYRPSLAFGGTDRLGTRPGVYVPGSRDLVLSVVPDIDIGDVCLTEPLIRLVVLNQVGLALAVVNQQVDDLLRSSIGTDAIDQFGLTAADVGTCTTDADCQARTIFGGRRSRCAGGICRTLRVEPRRVQVRPDGVELVLAQTASDPQAPLIAARVAAIGLDPAPASGDGLVCGTTRYYDREYSLTSYDPDDVQWSTAREIKVSESLPFADYQPFCDLASADAGLGCICEQTGIACLGVFVRQAGFSIPTGCPGGCGGATPCCGLASDFETRTCVPLLASGECPVDAGEVMTCNHGQCCGVTTGTCAF